MNNRQTIFKNVSALALMQGFTYLIPFLIIPYVLRTIGVDYFGKIAYAGSVTAFAQLILDYGFAYTATQETVAANNDKKTIGMLLANITFIKIALSAVVFVVLFVLCIYVPVFKKNSAAIYISFLCVAPYSLVPNWLFQGIKKMEIQLYLTVIARGIPAVLVFIVVRRQADYLWYLGVNALGAWAAMVVALYICIRKYELQPLSIHEMGALIRRGGNVFSTQIASAIMNSGAMVVLGFYADSATVGRYAVADKIIRLATSTIAPVSVAIFPHSKQLWDHDAPSAAKFLNKIFWSGSALYSILSLMIFIFADSIVVFIAGHSQPPITMLVRIMAILPLTVFMDNLFGVQNLMNRSKYRELMIAAFASAAILIIGSFTLIPAILDTGATISFLLAELTMLFLTLYFVVKTKNE
jgi:PST family polysaccharide transporter